MNPIHPRHAFNPRILWTYVFFQSHTSFFSTHAYFQRTHPHAPCPSPSFIIIVDVGMIWPWKCFYVALEFGNRELPRFLSLCLWLSNFENIYHIASYAVSLAVFRPWFQNFVLVYDGGYLYWCWFTWNEVKPQMCISLVAPHFSVYYVYLHDNGSVCQVALVLWYRQCTFLSSSTFHVFWVCLFICLSCFIHLEGSPHNRLPSSCNGTSKLPICIEARL